MTGNTYLVGLNCYHEYGSKIGKIVGQQEHFLEIDGIDETDGCPVKIFIFSNAITKICIKKEGNEQKVYISDT